MRHIRPKSVARDANAWAAKIKADAASARLLCLRLW